MPFRPPIYQPRLPIRGGGGVFQPRGGTPYKPNIGADLANLLMSGAVGQMKGTEGKRRLGIAEALQGAHTDYYKAHAEEARRPRPPKAPFTTGRIARLEGELESGGAASIYGYVIPFRSREDAIKHAQRTVGPDWETLSPRSKEIIDKNWPAPKSTSKPEKRKVTAPNVPKKIWPKKEYFTIGQVVERDGSTWKYLGRGKWEEQ